MDLTFLKNLTEAPGVPGREERIREIVKAEAAGLFDEWKEDPMGNLIGVCKPKVKPKKGGAPRKVMLACHLDEIGFYVKHIDEKGFLRLINVGGFDTRNLFSRRVLVQGRKDLVGIMNPSGKPIHIATDDERKKTYLVGEFYVDLFMPKKDVEKLVAIGDPVTIMQQTIQIGDVVTGKSMDNRVASFVAINAIRAAREKSPFEIYYVGAAQEEVGCRGAGPAAFGIAPDDGIAIDTTLACDTPGVSGDLAVTQMGKGVALKVMDGMSISTRSLFDEFAAAAKKHKIPHQFEILPQGGTDAATIQRSGGAKRVFTLSVPTRYVHTTTESIHLKDLKASIDLLGRWLLG
ncbi:MAG: M20/M25/M40 family metallo-hydrolase [Planctomycetota bacterium]|nr:M20/M25/M40 family metallo-hydrolase [Planctomycetota bacterium]